MFFKFGVNVGFQFWFVRALKVFLGVAALLFIVELLKQHSVQESLIFALTWSFITTAVFIGSRLYQSRKGVECALCNDIPDKSNKNT
jgi:hypothetical protein